MAISLPSGVFSKYNEAIVLFERTCKLIYPEKRTKPTKLFGPPPEVEMGPMNLLSSVRPFMRFF